MSSNTFKYCIVPKCLSTTISTPCKIFISMPKNAKIRNVWCKAMNRTKKHKRLSSNSTRYCCEDHFDLENDVENYTRWKMIGGPIRMRRDIVPHIFECQTKTKIRKRRGTNDQQTEIKQKTSQEETAENQEFPAEVVEVSYKEEIEDAFSEHEEDVLEQLENRKRMNQAPVQTPVPPKIMKVGPAEVLTVEVERESEHKVISQFPVDFMKTVLNSQDEILTVLKSQVLLQDTDTDLMKFLRLLGAKLQRLDTNTRKEVQNAVIDLVNERCYNVRL